MPSIDVQAVHKLIEFSCVQEFMTNQLNIAILAGLWW